MRLREDVFQGTDHQARWSPDTCAKCALYQQFIATGVVELGYHARTDLSKVLLCHIGDPAIPAKVKATWSRMLVVMIERTN